MNTIEKICHFILVIVAGIILFSSTVYLLDVLGILPKDPCQEGIVIDGHYFRHCSFIDPPRHHDYPLYKT